MRHALTDGRLPVAASLRWPAPQTDATLRPPAPTPQMGNAVAPPVAAGLGRCLLLAAAGAAPVGAAVIAAPDPEYDAVASACAAEGVQPYSVEFKVSGVSH